MRPGDLHPLQTFATLVVNCVTGLVLWQEYNVIAVPSSYVCVYLLVFEGVYIMSSLDVIASLRAYKAARVFRVESVADGTRINRSVRSATSRRPSTRAAS